LRRALVSLWLVSLWTGVRAEIHSVRFPETGKVDCNSEDRLLSILGMGQTFASMRCMMLQ